MADEETQRDADDSRADDAADDDEAARAADDDDPGDRVDDEDESPEALKAKLARAVTEEKKAKSRARAAEAKLSDAEKAKLTDTEKLELERDEQRTRADNAEVELRSFRAQKVAAKIGVKVDLVDAAAAFVKWDELNDPTDERELERVLREIVKDRPSLSGTNGRGGGGEGRSRSGGGEKDMNSLIRGAAGVQSD